MDEPTEKIITLYASTKRYATASHEISHVETQASKRKRKRKSFLTVGNSSKSLIS